ncbi:hypothetical protein AHF37_06159 [Paragonimus kellicotti]|nr:hypothetical protein AHF37_06159 [Paragonimus kellicotti]
MEGEFHGPVAIGSAQLEQVVSESAIVEQEIEVGSIAVERVETVERAELGEEFPTEAAAVVPHAVTVPVEAGPYLESIVVDEVRSELGRIDRIMEGEFHGPVAIGSAQLEQVVSESAIVEQEIEVGSIAVERVETVERAELGEEFPTEAAAVVPHAVTVPVEAGPYLESIVVDEVRSELGRIDRIMEGEFHGPVAIGSAQLEQVVSESAIVEQEIEVGSIAVERVETVERAELGEEFPTEAAAVVSTCGDRAGGGWSILGIDCCR